jgi:hypothetical protein
MITLDTLNVDAYRVNDLALSWDYGSTAESLSGYIIDVYRSEAPIAGTDLSEYTLIASGLSATTVSYIDTSVSGYFHHNRDWYYKLKITNISTLEYAVEPDIPAYLNKPGNVDRAYLEIIRRKTLALNKKVGRTFYLLKRHTMGSRCTECWDPISFRVTESNCTMCHGTGWIDGYFDPISFDAMTNDSPTFQEITMFGNFMPSDTLLFMLNFPLIKANDVIVDDNNDRWVVQNVRSVRKLNKILEQKVHLALIMADDPLYNIEVYG